SEETGVRGYAIEHRRRPGAMLVAPAPVLECPFRRDERTSGDGCVPIDQLIVARSTDAQVAEALDPGRQLELERQHLGLAHRQVVGALRRAFDEHAVAARGLKAQ